MTLNTYLSPTLEERTGSQDFNDVLFELKLDETNFHINL